MITVVILRSDNHSSTNNTSNDNYDNDDAKNHDANSHDANHRQRWKRTYWLVQVTKHGQGIYSTSRSVGTLGNPEVLETVSERPQDNHEVLPLWSFHAGKGEKPLSEATIYSQVFTWILPNFLAPSF